MKSSLILDTSEKNLKFIIVPFFKHINIFFGHVHILQWSIFKYNQIFEKMFQM